MERYVQGEEKEGSKDYVQMWGILNQNGELSISKSEGERVKPHPFRA